jgi:hypothetical protein
LFHGGSNGFTESQALAGTFADICEIWKPRYQQFLHADMLGRIIVAMQFDLHEALIVTSFDDSNRALGK